MKAILKTIMSGPEGTYYPGDMIEDSTGALVSGGYAEPVSGQETPEALELTKATIEAKPKSKTKAKG